MRKDKNGNILKIEDKLKSAKGEIFTIENFGGVTRLAMRVNGQVIKTIVFNDVDLTEMELIK